MISVPDIDDLLHQWQGTSWVRSLDMRSSYHQVRILEEIVPKTAFCTGQDSFQFKVLPFGLTNTPAAIQKVMNNTFSPFLGRFIVICTDDILVYRKSQEKHLSFSMCLTD